MESSIACLRGQMHMSVGARFSHDLYSLSSVMRHKQSYKLIQQKRANLQQCSDSSCRIQLIEQIRVARLYPRHAGTCIRHCVPSTRTITSHFYLSLKHLDQVDSPGSVPVIGVSRKDQSTWTSPSSCMRGASSESPQSDRSSDGNALLWHDKHNWTYIVTSSRATKAYRSSSSDSIANGYNRIDAIRCSSTIHHRCHRLGDNLYILKLRVRTRTCVGFNFTNFCRAVRCEISILVIPVLSGFQH